MQVHNDINNLPLFINPAVTIGTFDGVHTGHMQIIQQLKKEAKENNGESVIITFDPHPRMVINSSSTSKSPIKLLNTLSEKTELLGRHNVDHLVIVPFTLEFSNLSAEEYLYDFLVSKFHPKTIIIGYDHRFGKGRQGDYKLMEAYQEKYNYTVKEIPEHVLHHITISSTKIRHALNDGDVNTANEFLGYEYFFEGKIVEGNKLGRTLGFPTANIAISDENKLVPGNGIYVASVKIKSNESEPGFEFSSSHNGMMSIGVRPTIGGSNVVIEVNILDFDKDIYNKIIRVYVKKYLREEVKFNGLEELKIQMEKDKINTLQFLSNSK